MSRFTLLVLLLVSLFGCAKRKEPQKVKLGYLLNVTHAVPIVAIEEGLFDEYQTEHFVSGGYLLNSLMSKNIDIAYIGPGPYINAINKGLELELISLTTIGANALVLADKKAKDLEIKKIAIPQFGNTQDLLAHYLVDKVQAHKSHILKGVLDIAGDLGYTHKISFSKDLEFLAIHPSELELVLHKKEVDAALVAEPWGTLLAQKGYKNLSSDIQKKSIVTSLENEYDTNLKKELAYINTFPATLLVMRRDFYDKQPPVVDEFIAMPNYVLDIISLDTESAIESIQQHFMKIVGKSFSTDTVISSFENMQFSSELDFEKLNILEDVALAQDYIKEKKLLTAANIR